LSFGFVDLSSGNHSGFSCRSYESNFYSVGVLFFFQGLNGIVFWQVSFASIACFSMVTEHVLQCLSTIDLCISITSVKIGKNFGIMISNTG